MRTAASACLVDRLHVVSQDFLTSAFLLTSKDRFYSRAQVAQFACFMGDGMDAMDLPQPALLKPLELWTGKQLFSMLIRPNALTRCPLHILDTASLLRMSGITIACVEHLAQHHFNFSLLH